MKKILILLLVFSVNTFASTKLKDSPIDGRIKHVTYQKNQVYPVNLHNRIQTTITVAKYEKILVDTILFGADKLYAPLVIPDHESEISIRPLYDNPKSTNLSFKTDAGRKYHFYIDTTHYRKKRIPNDLAFEVIFDYKNSGIEQALIKQQKERDYLLNLSKLELLGMMQQKEEKPSKDKNNRCSTPNLKNINLNYSLEGDMELRPKIIYDDGKFTYIKFDKEIGTIVSLDKNNSPSNVNFHVDNCGVFVVHKVMTKIAITKNNENNKRATCITNLSFKTEEG